MDKLMNPLFLAVGALALIALLQLALYIDLRREMQRMQKMNEGKIKDAPESGEAMRSEMLRISEELVAMNPPPANVSIGQSMNLSRRNQVLRMHLRGDSPSRIATALKISKSEVDLLLKVHRSVVPLTKWTPPTAPVKTRRPGDLRSSYESEIDEVEETAQTA